MRVCTVRMSVPDSSRCVANECLSVWQAPRAGVMWSRVNSSVPKTFFVKKAMALSACFWVACAEFRSSVRRTR